MKKVLKHLLVVFVLISTFILIDYSVNLSGVDAGNVKVPTNVKLEKVSDTSIKLTWDKIEGIESYEIYTKKDDQYIHITSIKNVNTTSWMQNNLSFDKKYTYAVKAKSIEGIESDYSKLVSTSIEDYSVKEIPILTFHRITTDENKRKNYNDDEWVAPVSEFKKQIKYLYDNNYKTISASEFENWYYGKVEYPKKTVMLTFDDGDYEFYHIVYPLLKKYNFKATSFIIGSYTGSYTPNLKSDARYRLGKDVIKKLAYEYPNIKFESHSYNLHYRTNDDRPIVLTKSYQDIMKDFENNESFEFKYLAYPYGARTKEFIKAAGDSGIHLAFTFGQKDYRKATRNDKRLEIPRLRIDGDISYADYIKTLEEK